MRWFAWLSIPCLLLLFACERQAEKSVAALPAPALVDTGRAPPAPPVLETFDGEPRLSLFPRVGAFRPEDEDDVALPFWRTYIDHLTRISGVVQLPAPVGRGRVFAIRSLDGLDSAGFFSPLAVEPETVYEVSSLVKADLPTGASAGLGILEFDDFVWLSEQFPRSLAEKRQVGAREGIRLEGTSGWRQVGFRFTTGPRTRMVHLIIFREGPESREPVLVDDIRMEKISPES